MGRAPKAGQPSRVVVIGGGPAGSVTAAALRQRGLEVTVFEKAAFPRFHLGESLLPESLPVLEAIGVLPAVRAAFIPKLGARFHDDIRNRKERFVFAGAWKPAHDHAFEVPRDAFDELLLRHAASLGAEVRHGWTVRRLVRSASLGSRVVGVEVAGPDGALSEVSADYVVDASGRDALTAHEGASAKAIDGLDQTALYAHFEGVPREPGLLAGDIDIVLFPSGSRAPNGAEDPRPNWFWFIPFADGRTSVGAVVSRAWIRRESGKLAGGAARTTTLFEEAVRQSPTATRLLATANRLWPAAEAAADFSYKVGVRHGPGWLAIGDAGGFIDPLFSTGVHLAISGGHRAAHAIAEVLGPSAADDADENATIGTWAADIDRATETFLLAVEAFYRGPLVEQLFAPDKHAALRRSITSLLAGDVFGDAIWLRDARKRLRAMLGQRESSTDERDERAPAESARGAGDQVSF